jgi:DNA-binding transcriptional regulator YhcF (GntR family)
MDFKSNIPIYLQVIQDIKRKIISGQLPLGSKLPSSRELAIQYQINPNTAARVYNEMEAMGLSFTRRGIGTFVVEDSAIISKLKEEQVNEIIAEFDSSISALGFSPQEIVDMLKEHYSL